MSTYKWDKNRPKRPDRDPQLTALRRALDSDNRSRYAQANVSGLAPQTITNIINGKTRQPQSVTMQMAWGMLGYDYKPVARGRKGR